MCAASAWKRIWDLLASKNTEIFAISVVEMLYQLSGPTVIFCNYRARKRKLHSCCHLLLFYLVLHIKTIRLTCQFQKQSSNLCSDLHFIFFFFPLKCCKVCHRSVRAPQGNSGLQLICINLCRQEDDVHFSLVSVYVLVRSCAGVTGNKMEGLREDFKNNYRRFFFQPWHG